MNLSEDTLSVLEFLKNYSENTLRKPNDIGVILEIGAITNNPELVNNIIFTGKSIWNMHRSIQKQMNSSTSVENSSSLENELKSSILQLHDLLYELSADSDEETEMRFRDVYFQNNRGSFLNLIDLSHDLAIFKQLQSDLFRKKE